MINASQVIRREVCVNVCVCVCSPFCETFRRPRMKMRGKKVGQRICAYVKSSGGGMGGIFGRSMQVGSLWCREVVVQQESDADLLLYVIYIYFLPPVCYQI